MYNLVDRKNTECFLVIKRVANCLKFITVFSTEYNKTNKSLY